VLRLDLKLEETGANDAAWFFRFPVDLLLYIFIEPEFD
jgi:hypothetical protein